MRAGLFYAVWYGRNLVTPARGQSLIPRDDMRGDDRILSMVSFMISGETSKHSNTRSNLQIPVPVP